MTLHGLRYRSVVLLSCVALALTGLGVALNPASVLAQTQGAPLLSNQQLDALTAPIALYPDPLLAQVLMASTFDQDVLAAATWSRANPNLQGDAAVKAVASQPWDPSVQSLVAFPQVLATMASKPDWVIQLGNAFLAQPNDVMDSVQRLRRQAQAAGHLKSDTQQKVIVEQTVIQIQPANPQVVYVPMYNPTVVYGAWAYPAYPPVYLPPPPGYAIASGLAVGIAFGAGIAISNALWGGFNWNTHNVNVNVNHYNNINVNNRISATGGTTNWNRNVNRNANINNANINNANINRNAANVSSSQLDAYRGRDASRAQAQQTLQNRTGENVGGTASNRVQSINKGGTSAKGANVAGNAGARGAAPPATNRAKVRNSAQNVNRDNALRNAGDGNAARQETQRGQASRAALSGGNGGAAQRGTAAGNPRGGVERTSGARGGNAGGMAGARQAPAAPRGGGNMGGQQQPRSGRGQ